jgi:hypothetical protein
MSLSASVASPHAPCQLAAGERITAARVASEFKLVFGVPVVIGLELHTSLPRTCGPYGTMRSTIQKATGHQLLYVNSKLHSALDSLEFHFDY